MFMSIYVFELSIIIIIIIIIIINIIIIMGDKNIIKHMLGFDLNP